METQGLKGRWRIFAEKVASGLSATDAYLQAGFKPRNRENAHRGASRLQRRPEVAACIQALRRQAAAGAGDTLTLQEKLSFLARTVKTSAAQVGEQDDLCQSFRTYRDGSTALRIPCKLRAIKLHSELAGDLHPPPDASSVGELTELLRHIRSGHLLASPAPHPGQPAAPTRG